MATQIMLIDFQTAGENSTGTVVIWDLATGGERFRAKGGTGSAGPAVPERVAWTANGIRVAETDTVGTTLFAPTDRTVATTTATWEKPTNAMMFHPDGKRICVICDDGTDWTWDFSINRIGDRWLGSVSAIPARPDLIATTFAFAPDGNSVALNTANSALVIWDTKTRKERTRFTGEIAQCSALAVTPDGKTLVTAASPPLNRIRLWDIETGKEAHVRRTDTAAIDRFSAHAGRADIRRFRCCKSDANRRHRHRPRTLAIGNLHVSCPVLSPNGTQLALVQNGNRVLIHDFANRTLGSKRRRIDVSADIHALTFPPDGKRLATACADGIVRIYDTATGKPLCNFRRLGRLCQP